jgi:hypothetical protein
VRKKLDMMFGLHIDAHIMGISKSLITRETHTDPRTQQVDMNFLCKIVRIGHIFIHSETLSYCHIVKTGDKIFIFGFSRGAYTARALAGMYVINSFPTTIRDRD